MGITNSRKQRASRVRRSLYVAAIIGISLSPACSSKPSYYRGAIGDGTNPISLALLPLTNFSENEKAADVVASQLLVELLNFPNFSITDPGRVDEVVTQMRLRVPERLPLETLQEVGRALDVPYVMVGTVNEYGFVSESGDPTPHVSISLRIISCVDGSILWAASHSRRGDEGESVFGWGRTGTVEQLAAETVEEITRSLRP
jgi:TolB-like protein